MLIVADKNTLLVLSGTGEVIDPDDGVCCHRLRRQFRPGGGARAGAATPSLSAEEIAVKALAGSRVHLRVYQRPYHRGNALRRQVMKELTPREIVRELDRYIIGPG